MSARASSRVVAARATSESISSVDAPASVTSPPWPRSAELANAAR
jgi:hypothetical protein